MQRGFKKWAEEKALEQRRGLGIRPEGPLLAKDLARNLKITIIEPGMIPGFSEMDEFGHLLTGGSDGWSAATLVHSRCTVIIQNPTHSQFRQESDLMHELAHILCGHAPSRLVQLNGLPAVLREFDPEKEEEAVWLGGCLQLPRSALIWALRRGMEHNSIVDFYKASSDLVKYRRQVTGVDNQLRRYKAR